MHVNRSGITVIIKAPNLIQQLIPRVNPVRVACQVINKLKLLRRRVYFNAVYLKLIICKVYAQLIIPYLVYLRAFIAVVGSSQHRFDSCNYLFCVKRLAYIIIGAKLQPQYFIKGFALCRKHYYRRFARFANFTANLPAVKLWQHYIQQNKVWRIFGCIFNRLLAVTGHAPDIRYAVRALLCTAGAAAAAFSVFGPGLWPILLGRTALFAVSFVGLLRLTGTLERSDTVWLRQALRGH